MQPIYDESFEMIVADVKVGESHQQGYYPVKLTTSRGSIHCRYYPVKGTQKAAIWVGGIGGDWDTPAEGLYPQLCQELTSEGIASLRVRYRYSTKLEEAVLDVLAGITFLQDEGIESIALIGHSFGGAVVIQAAAQAEDVRTVITLATQSYGAAPVLELATRCSILLLHGTADPILSPLCSQHVYDIALEPKHLICYPGASHSLDEVAEDVHACVRDWLIKQLKLNLPPSVSLA
ncbi:MAG: dienelactone hydrolase family protein [Coleofasciculaceae cyanobacterium]